MKETQDYGLKFSVSENVVGFADADWAGDVDSSVQYLCSRKQATVTKSTTEAEYVSTSLATQEAVWIRRLINDLEMEMRCSHLL